MIPGRCSPYNITYTVFQSARRRAQWSLGGVARIILHTLCVSVGPTEGPIIPGRCGRDEATCQNGQCVPRDYLCDGDFDCSDRSDEADCSE